MIREDVQEGARGTGITGSNQGSLDFILGEMQVETGVVHQGVLNAWNTLMLGNGMKQTVSK